MHSPPNRIQFEAIHTSNVVNVDVKYEDTLFICTAVLVVVYVVQVFVLMPLEFIQREKANTNIMCIFFSWENQ